jgi:hypothetical protein
VADNVRTLDEAGTPDRTANQFQGWPSAERLRVEAELGRLSACDRTG